MMKNKSIVEPYIFFSKISVFVAFMGIPSWPVYILNFFFWIFFPSTVH